MLLVLGLFTRPAALSVIIFMIFSIHFTSAKGFFWTSGRHGIFDPDPARRAGVLIRGGGEYSLDKTMAKEF